MCLNIYIHTIKLSFLLLLTIVKFCALSKNSVEYFTINGVHKVHVCAVYHFNSFVSFLESVENSLKPIYSLQYTVIYCFCSEILLNDYSVLGMIILLAP